VEKNKKKAEESGKSNAKKAEQQKNAAGGAGKPDDELKGKMERFDKIKTMKPSDMASAKLTFFDGYGLKGNISANVQTLFVRSEGISYEMMEARFTTDNPKVAETITKQLAGEIGNENATKALKQFERIKREPYPNNNSNLRIDVIAQSEKEVTMMYRTQDDMGKFITKEEVVKAGDIVGIESKSYGHKAFMDDSKIDHLVEQIKNSTTGDQVDKTYAYLSKDFEDLPLERRTEITRRVREAGGEIMISDKTSLENKARAEKIAEDIAGKVKK